jgi:hypothetical protein
MTEAYPERSAARDRWILARRPPRNAVAPRLPAAFLLEEERSASGEIVPVATIFLANRECPWRCLMCDLWKNTLTETVPPGAIPAQIDSALARLVGMRSTASQPHSVGVECRDAVERVPTRQIKLYNAGSFFDPRAIPPEDYPAIAARVCGFERVVVECHPALVNERCLRFRELIAGQLEVAMGLEIAHPDVLEKLNKRMTLDQFRRAAEFLRAHAIALRAFVLVKPPFLDEAEALHWAERSVDFAFDCVATVVSLIPTRPGNGALEALMAQGQFAPPKLATLEAAAAYGVALRRGRVFADLWDLEKFSECPACFAARAARLREMNRRQIVPPPVDCQVCSDSAASMVAPRAGPQASSPAAPPPAGRVFENPSTSLVSRVLRAGTPAVRSAGGAPARS